MARANKKKLGLTPEAVLGDGLAPNELRAEMYRQTFTGGAGEWVLNDLKITFNDRSSFVPDSNATVFHEGQRDVYRMITALIAEAIANDGMAETK
jgi:hypothetical protein